MYKNQMILQRITSFLLLAAAVLVFVYSLGIMTDLYNCLYLVSGYTNPKLPNYVEGSQIYREMQGFNRQLTTAGIVLILSAASLFIFRTNDRRKYYIANYITVGVNAVLNIAVAIWMRIEVLKYKSQYLSIDLDRLEAIVVDKLNLTDNVRSTFWFDVVNVVFVALILVTAISIFNIVFKTILMSAERKLVKEGLEESHG